MQNGFVENFNSRMHDDMLNRQLFDTRRNIVVAWRTDFNQHRPHSSLDGKTQLKHVNRSKERQNLNAAS